MQYIDPEDMPDRLTVNGVAYVRAESVDAVDVPIGRTLPMQPIIRDANGAVRFRANRLVTYLLDHGGLDMNALHRALMRTTPREDWAQFAQLIGYSVGGYGSLSYALNVEEADAAAERLMDGGG